MEEMAECPLQAHSWLLSLPYKQRRRLMRWLSRGFSLHEQRLMRPWHRAVMNGSAVYLNPFP